MQNLVRRIGSILGYGHIVLACVCLAAVSWGYSPGLAGPFVLDDFGNVIGNDRIRVAHGVWQEFLGVALSYGRELLGRPLSMLSLALDGYLSDFTPYRFKLTNLVIHLLNWACLLVLGRLLLMGYDRARGREPSPGNAWLIALFVATLWALHPLNLTSVLYVVQRMTSLASLFIALGLVAYAWARLELLRSKEERSRATWPLLWLALPLCGALAFSAKEIGILLPLYVFVLEAGVFRFRCAEVAGRRGLLTFQLAYVLLPCLIGAFYLATHLGGLLGYYDVRSFGLAERLLTQPRVLWFYLRLILAPDISAMGLYHDDFPVSSGVMQPATTLPAMFALLFLVAWGAWALYKGRWFGFGIAWFVAGHLLESSILPLELVFEHRNYLPMYGVLLAVCVLFVRLATPWSRFLKVSLVFLPLVYLAGTTHLRALEWANGMILATTEAFNHPDSFRANYQAGRAFHQLYQQLPGDTFYRQAEDYYLRAQDLASRHPAPQVELIALRSLGDGGVPPASYARLKDSVAAGVLTPDSLKILHFLEQCDAEGPCKLPEGYFSALMDAILANPKVIARQRADVLNLHGQYLIKRSRGYDAALPMLGDAHRLDPGNFSYGRDLVQAEILAGRAREARRDLTDLSVRFNTRNFSQPILDLQTQLNLISPP